MRPEEVMITVASLLLFAMIGGLIAWARWLRFRELVALADRGFAPPDERADRRTLRIGLILAAIGLALCLGLYPITAAEFRNVFLGFGPPMLAGLLPLFIGIAFVLSWALDQGAPALPPSYDDEPWPFDRPDVTRADIEEAREAALRARRLAERAPAIDDGP